MSDEASGRGTKPDPKDVHVGARIRLRRSMLGLSQERLAEALGVTFQQVQKYERGVNRVGASRLYDMARVLDVPIGFFYDDMPGDTAGRDARLAGARPVFGLAELQQAFADDPGTRRETQDLVRAYYRINDSNVRKRVLELIRSLAPEGAT
jgi:transcriptional regulator with XRE-family HTH domain